jgi:hypothetical protein
MLTATVSLPGMRTISRWGDEGEGKGWALLAAAPSRRVDAHLRVEGGSIRISRDRRETRPGRVVATPEDLAAAHEQ